MGAFGTKRKPTCKTPSSSVSEEIQFTWEVKDFRAMISTATNAELKAKGYCFEAGDNIELPTSWKLYLKKKPHNNRLGIYLQLLKAPEEAPNVKAAFAYKTSRHENNYKVPNEFTPNSSAYGLDNAFFCLGNFSENNLENGSLVIHITFNLHKEVILEADCKRAKFLEKSVSAVVTDFQNLLESGENADVTFKFADGRTLKAHSTVLIARSRVFTAMLQSPMEEAATGIIHIEDVSYVVMKRILTFIYSGRLDDKWEEVLAEIVYAANKYELMFLMTFCDETLVTTCKPETALSLMDFAKLHGLNKAEYEIGEYVKSHIDEIVQAKIASPV